LKLAIVNSTSSGDGSDNHILFGSLQMFGWKTTEERLGVWANEVPLVIEFLNEDSEHIKRPIF
jgi:hypothetical protein